MHFLFFFFKLIQLALKCNYTNNIYNLAICVYGHTYVPKTRRKHAVL